uniref:CWF19-like protein 2 n=1 Tax=Latimeria chalumnae TaxID=7897 RepID=H3ANC0_LATCH
AKTDYEKEERRKELKHLRGEDTWMLPEVSEHLEKLAEEHSVKEKKKKKKEKKSKKAKKEKKKKDKKDRKKESSDSSSNSEDEWVEAKPALQSGNIEKAWKVKKEICDSTGQSSQRDEWMTLDFMTIKTVSTAALRAEKEKEQELQREKTQALEQAGLRERELNPYWKDGGSGLPPEDHDSTPVKKAIMVEDGGLSWLKKSYQRMNEQAEREKRSLEEVVAERYGSMEQFQKRLEEAEKKVPLHNQAKDPGRERWRKPRNWESKPSEEGERRHNRNKDRYYKSDRERECYSDQQKDTGKRAIGDKYGNIFQEQTESCRPLKEAEGNERRQEKVSSLSSLKTKFMKPSENEDSSACSNNWGFKALSSSTAQSSNSPSSCFRKPENDSDGLSSRSRAQAREGVIGEMSEQQSVMVEKFKPKQERAPKAEGKMPQGEHGEESPMQTESSQESQVSSSRYGTVEESARVLSEEEMNKLGAKIVKAELMGNMDLAAKFKAQLENARKFKASQPQSSSDSPASLEDGHEVVLVRTDQSGRAWPVNAPTDPVEPKGGRRKRQLIGTHTDGERVRYFYDDDKHSLRELVKREKMETAEDQNARFIRMASKFMEKTDRDYYTLDDMFVSKAAKKEHSGQEEERQRQKAISDHQQLAARMEKCPYCFDNPELPKHLVIAIGIKVYLCLPNCQSLAEGHCLIVPLQHHTAGTTLDEDIWDEIQEMFRKVLVKMFEDRGLDCVFLETSMNLKKRYHLVYECIPLPKEQGDMAPIYFKKAIMECDEEWAMNKKLIDLSSRDVRRAVPKGLPYFSVDFGLQGGFAHVIENERKFPYYFGKEVIGGMLDLEPRCWRKPIRENFDDQRKKVLQFAQWWKPYDCTKNKGQWIH